MKTDLSSVALRWALAWFLLCLTALFLYLSGSAQSFLEATQEELFRMIRWVTWGGLLSTWFVLVPLCRRLPRRAVAAGALGTGFAGLFMLILFWGAWIYPDAGVLSW